MEFALVQNYFNFRALSGIQDIQLSRHGFIAIVEHDAFLKRFHILPVRETVDQRIVSLGHMFFG
jgi:hypothetical protein